MHKIEFSDNKIKVTICAKDSELIPCHECKKLNYEINQFTYNEKHYCWECKSEIQYLCSQLEYYHKIQNNYYKNSECWRDKLRNCHDEIGSLKSKIESLELEIKEQEFKIFMYENSIDE